MAGNISSAFHLADQDIDQDEFYTRMIKLDVNDEQGLSSFLNDYKFKKLSMKGLNRDLIFAGREVTALFDDFILEIWKKYYVSEDVVQIAILQGTLPFPLEVRKITQNIILRRYISSFQFKCMLSRLIKSYVCVFEADSNKVHNHVEMNVQRLRTFNVK